MAKEENNILMNKMNSQNILNSSSWVINSSIGILYPRCSHTFRLLLSLLMSMLRVWDEAARKEPKGWLDRLKR